MWPVAVQGNNAEQEIESAILGFNSLKKTRCYYFSKGGGSLEDLMSFNSEKIAHAIFNSDIPIISAVGHETDFLFQTLCLTTELQLLQLLLM